MTKVVIQIPCFNEEETLPVALAELPRSLPGADTVEWLVINDGSSDRTVEVARRHGVDHIVDLPQNQGLARAFQAGLRASLKAGADIVVNTDADNQYHAGDIPKLIEPILAGRAELVIGVRPIRDIEHFSPAKKLMQRLGSWVVRMVSGTDVPDAPSGFRAISRAAALRLNVFNSYTYTLETIIQAGRKGIPVTWVPVRTNPYLRPSRLMRSTVGYVVRSLVTIGRIFMTYKPMRFFAYLGSVPFSAGVLLGMRWVVLYFDDPTRGRVPSLVLAAILLLMGFQVWVLGLIADLMNVNRTLLEELQLSARERDLAAVEDAGDVGGDEPA
jgi:glycosyltransferase involved in cell wall biosynthesis